MTRRQELAARIAMGVLAVAILASGAIFALSIATSDLHHYADQKTAEEAQAAYERAVTTTDISRVGCASTNVLRQALWNNDMIDSVTRKAAAADLGHQFRVLAKQTQADARALVRAVAEAPLKPGSPQRDCARVYVAPEPPPGITPIPQKPIPATPITPFRPPK